MKIGAATLFGTLCLTGAFAQNISIDQLYGHTTYDRTGEAVALSGDGSLLVVGSPSKDDDQLGEDIGEVTSYMWKGNAWERIGETLTGNNAGELFGKSLALSSDGKVLAVASPWDATVVNQGGSVRIYRWTGSSWAPSGSSIYGESAGDFLGTSLALSATGDFIIIGAVGTDEGGLTSGQAQVYRWAGRNYERLGNAIIGEEPGDQAGAAVAISADGLRVGVAARYGQKAGEGKGQVRVFDWNGQDWQLLGRTIGTRAGASQFGNAIALSADGQRLAIGAPGSRGSANTHGSVQVFDWTSNSWTLKGEELEGDAAGDAFGGGLALSGDGNILVVGANKNDSNGTNSGQLKIFSWYNGKWENSNADILGGKGARSALGGDRLGTTVSLSVDGQVLAGGAPGRPEAHVVVARGLQEVIVKR